VAEQRAMSMRTPRTLATRPLPYASLHPHSPARVLAPLNAPYEVLVALSVGLVGLPNVGKSTLFNALSRAGAEAANFPFCTIEPNVGVVPVPDVRLTTLAQMASSQRTVPTSMRFVDIAGLVEGASKGEGLGNQFLAHIREVDAICHVVRCFDDPDVIHVRGGIDPLGDIEIVETELLLKDLETLEKRGDRSRRAARSGDKALQREADLIVELTRHLEDGHPARSWHGELDPSIRRELALLSDKPVIFAANVAEADLASGNAASALVSTRATERGDEVALVSARVEAELAELDDAERSEYLASLGVDSSGLQRLIATAYRLLGLVTFLTVGPQEARAWTVADGATAPQAAGTIHTDFERGFIKAEVIAYDDYVTHGGEAGARDAGRLRIEGREYRIVDGDVVHFRHNV
jgi:ribosome-binding ATPase